VKKIWKEWNRGLKRKELEDRKLALFAKFLDKRVKREGADTARRGGIARVARSDRVLKLESIVESGRGTKISFSKQDGASE
jgi:hypothetical protein